MHQSGTSRGQERTRILRLSRLIRVYGPGSPTDSAASNTQGPELELLDMAHRRKDALGPIYDFCHLLMHGFALCSCCYSAAAILLLVRHPVFHPGGMPRPSTRPGLLVMGRSDMRLLRPLSLLTDSCCSAEWSLLDSSSCPTLLVLALQALRGGAFDFT